MVARSEVTGKGTKNEVPPSERGTHSLSVPQAGAMIGLSRNASYEAAARKEIPTIAFGKRLIVPKAVWLRKLGVDVQGNTAA
jgi:hypothetical protein